MTHIKYIISEVIRDIITKAEENNIKIPSEIKEARDSFITRRCRDKHFIRSKSNEHTT
jgi:hypothetical protein